MAGGILFLLVPSSRVGLVFSLKISVGLSLVYWTLLSGDTGSSADASEYPRERLE
jgi:hypothetical protein